MYKRQASNDTTTSTTTMGAVLPLRELQYYYEGDDYGYIEAATIWVEEDDNDKNTNWLLVIAIIVLPSRFEFSDGSSSCCLIHRIASTKHLRRLRNNKSHLPLVKWWWNQLQPTGVTDASPPKQRRRHPRIVWNSRRRRMCSSTTN